MSNLTKYDVLKHRHLSLLQELEKAGVSANYSQIDGEWKIGVPAQAAVPFTQPPYIRIEQFDKNGKLLAITSTVGDNCSAVMRHDTDSVAVTMESVRNMKHQPPVPIYSQECKFVFNGPENTMHDATFHAKEPRVQFYAQDVWKLAENGEVTYMRDAPHNAPEWVKAKRDEWNAASPLDKMLIDMREEGFTFAVHLQDGGHIAFYTPDKVPTRVALTPVLTHLLAAISSVIVAASPAKVD